MALLWVCLFSVEMSFSFPESESNSFIHVSSLIIYSLAPLRHFWSGGKRRLKLNIPAPYSWLVYNWRNDWKPKNGWRNHRLQVDSLASLITATVVWVITVLWLNSYGWGGGVLWPGTEVLHSWYLTWQILTSIINVCCKLNSCQQESSAGSCSYWQTLDGCWCLRTGRTGRTDSRTTGLGEDKQQRTSSRE